MFKAMLKSVSRHLSQIFMKLDQSFSSSSGPQKYVYTHQNTPHLTPKLTHIEHKTWNLTGLWWIFQVGLFVVCDVVYFYCSFAFHITQNLHSLNLIFLYDILDFLCSETRCMKTSKCCQFITCFIFSSIHCFFFLFLFN